MASESISVMIITIASVILAAMVAVALFSQFSIADSIMRITAKSVESKLQSSLSIVLVSLNTSSEGQYFVIFVKNTGSRSISSREIERMDVYLRDSSTTIYMPYGSGYNHWNYMESQPDGVWSVGETLMINTYNATALTPPIYVRIVLPNGVGAEYVYTG
ncbi:MAG: hypothetical protein QXQ20_08530 [Candidatus Nezhaarchaeales archaeon]